MYTNSRKAAGSRRPARGRAARQRQRQRYLPAVDRLEGRTLLSTLTVLNNADSGTGSLRDTIAAAASGDTINFDPSLDGQTITLTSGQLLINKSLSIEGPGADELTISGGGASRVFEVLKSTSTPVSVDFSGLTVADGHSGSGAGLLNDFGTVTITACQFTGNTSSGGGAAVFNQVGTITITNSTIDHNVTSGTDSFLLGGAVFNSTSSTLNVTGTTFLDNGIFNTGTGQGGGGGVYNAGNIPVFDSNVLEGNVAQGGTFGGGNGGAIMNDFFSQGMAITNCVFHANQALGNDGPTAGARGLGGAIESVSAKISVADSTFVDNLAQGGAATGASSFSGGGAGNGGAIEIIGTPFSFPPVAQLFSNDTFVNNQAIGGASISAFAGGGGAAGGALFNSGGRLDLESCSFVSNTALGGSNDTTSFSSSASGGAVMNTSSANLTLNDSVLVNNTAQGGDGVHRGGSAQGGAIMNQSATLALTNSVLASNSAIGGDAGPGGTGGNAVGGALAVFGGTVCVQGDTLVANRADGGTAGAGGTDGTGVGGAIFITFGGKVGIQDSKLKANKASTSNDDVFGTFSTTC